MGQVEGMIVSIIWAVICHNFDMNMRVPLHPQALIVFSFFYICFSTSAKSVCDILKKGNFAVRKIEVRLTISEDILQLF